MVHLVLVAGVVLEVAFPLTRGEGLAVRSPQTVLVGEGEMERQPSEIVDEQV